MMNDTFMKEKPVLPLILSMSLPMVLSMLVNSLYNIIDSFFVAQISEEAMTALSLVYPVQNFINAAGIGFGVGINAVIAFYLGAGDHRKADQAATQGLVLAVIHGVVMTVCCITIMPVFLRMFTSSEAVIELGVRYSVVAFAFTLIVTVSMAFEKLFQAVGNMKTTMISLMCGCITNIVLDPVLIFGYGPFPEMGIEGAALATGIGQALTLTIYLVIYLARPIRVHIRRQYILPSKKMVIKLYSIGIPATLNLALPSLLISALNAILAADRKSISIFAPTAESMEQAKELVQYYDQRPDLGKNYMGKVRKVLEIGAIVEIMPNVEALVHISQLDTSRVAQASDVAHLGEDMLVKVIEINGDRIRASRKAVLLEEQGIEWKPEDTARPARAPRGEGDRDHRGDRGDRGERRERRPRRD